MKKKILFVSLFVACAIGATSATLLATEVFKPVSGHEGECAGNHYNIKVPTASDAGCREYWICCGCHKVYTEKPNQGRWTDAGISTFIPDSSSDPRYIAPNSVFHYNSTNGTFTCPSGEEPTKAPDGCIYYTTTGSDSSTSGHVLQEGKDTSDTERAQYITIPASDSAPETKCLKMGNPSSDKAGKVIYEDFVYVPQEYSSGTLGIGIATTISGKKLSDLFEIQLGPHYYSCPDTDVVPLGINHFQTYTLKNNFNLKCPFNLMRIIRKNVEVEGEINVGYLNFYNVGRGIQKPGETISDKREFNHYVNLTFDDHHVHTYNGVKYVSRGSYQAIEGWGGNTKYIRFQVDASSAGKAYVEMDIATNSDIGLLSSHYNLKNMSDGDSGTDTEIAKVNYKYRGDISSTDPDAWQSYTTVPIGYINLVNGKNEFQFSNTDNEAINIKAIRLYGNVGVTELKPY